ncbi:MAG: trehalose-6-phosphate synthase [Elusimicrobia bacterium]|nr:trehalose-6-phosphate synthase [Elusimicrobiota bacterium]
MMTRHAMLALAARVFKAWLAVCVAAFAFSLLWPENVALPVRFLREFAEVTLLVLGTLLAVHWSMRHLIQQLADWMRLTRTGQTVAPPPAVPQGLLAPLVEEAATMAQSLSRAQSSAELEARLRLQADSLWTAERLREQVKAKLQGRSLLVVGNRQPYRHVRRGGAVTFEMPASGLVTGLEPVLRACGGTWIGQGDGNADKETADEHGRLRVPPDDPQYVLRRVWLSPEEEAGFYYGFSNEGLWPLCHIAHTRPVFRAADWEHYQAVNRKFAEAVLEEIVNLEEPFLLIQDYHFTLLPRMIKERRPDARVALFWHIPWPNAEAFGICPWQTQLLSGMLASDIVGFHTQYHCNNFLDTVDRVVECRIDREHFSVQRGSHTAYVKPFPISVAFSEPVPGRFDRARARAIVKEKTGASAPLLAVGVDRMDYTKGIAERFRGVERFLEKYPRYMGKFSLVQLGAPSRTNIQAYGRFVSEMEAEARRINERFDTEDWQPIVLVEKHHSHEEILPFYQAADVCMVTSLHDGMNLVAKEFVAAREDDRGSLILSRFTGAARELQDALLINPYDAEDTAEAIRAAVEMSETEQALRMVRLRRTVRENNVYRWAANLISELAAVRLDIAVRR